MLEKIRQSKILTLLLLTAVVYFFLQYLTPLFSPILVAMLFVTIFGPFLKKLQAKFHIHRQVGAVLLLLLGVSLLAVLVWVLFSWAVGSLPEWVGQLEAVEQELEELIQKGSASIGEVLGSTGNIWSPRCWRGWGNGWTICRRKERRACCPVPCNI